MRVRVVNGVGRKTEIFDSAGSVTIADDHGNVLAVAVQTAHGVTSIHRLGDPGFEKAIKLLGISQVAKIEQVTV